MVSSVNVWGESKTVTYTISSTTAVSTSGTAPTGSSASFSTTYTNKNQLTKGNSHTFTLSGFDGCTITGLTVNCKTNSSSGVGSYTLTINGSSKGTLSISKIGDSYTNKTMTVTSTKVNNSTNVTLVGNCTTNSLYTNSITITYTPAPAEKYTVTFNPCSGTCSTSSLTEESAGAGVTLPSASPSTNCATAGWTFAGWKETSAQTETTTKPTLYAAGSNYKPSANCTLYAVYSKTESSGGGSTTESVSWNSRYSGTTDVEGVELTIGTNAKVTHNKGNNNNKCQYYDTGTGIRVYGGGNFVVTASGSDITAISLTFGSGDNSNEITANTGTYSNGSWSGKATSVTFSVGGTSNHRRIAGISVTYSGGSTTTYNSNPSCGPATYTLNFVAGSNGSVSAPSIADLSGEQTITLSNNTLTINGTTITANPNSGYKFKNWTIGGSAVTNGQKVSAACTITANFEAIPQLSKPTGLSVSNITSSGVTLSWNAVANATKYTVTIIDKADYNHDFTNITTTSTTINDLSPSTEYIWSVKAIGDGTNNLDSEESEYGDFTTASACESPITISKNTATLPSGCSFSLDKTSGCGDDAGESVLVTCLPATHYTVTAVNSTSGTPGAISNNKCTVSGIKANAIISVTFTEDPTYTVTFLDGVHSTDCSSWNMNSYAGTQIVFRSITDKTAVPPTGDCEADHYHFVGWVEENTTPTQSPSNVITAGTTSVKITKNITYKAVWAKEEL